jgi:prepilin-type N-terminal cleavage/methylation domain-containing protein
MFFLNSVKKLGFTMIELLIVIAVLGILAVAVLSAINPIEQINRGKDTGSRSDAEQLLSSIDRFYAGKGFYPWMIGADSDNEEITNNVGGGVAVLTEITALDQEIGDDATPFLTNLSSGGAAEIKESFVTRVIDDTYNTLSIYNNGVSGSSTYICFTPKSSSFREEAWKRCSTAVGAGSVGLTMPTDFPAEACPATDCDTAATAAAATACMICLP